MKFKLIVLMFVFLSLFSTLAHSLDILGSEIILSTSTKIEDYKYEVVDKDGLKLSTDAVKNSIDKTSNTLLDCDILTCDYKLEVTASQNLIYDQDTLVGKYIGKGVKVEPIFYYDTRTVVKERPKYIVSKSCSDHNGSTTCKDKQEMEISGTETYTETETFENTKLDAPLLKDATRTYIIRFKKSDPNLAVDIYHSIYGVDRKDAAWWNSTYNNKKIINVINWTCNDAYCQFPFKINFTGDNGSYIRILNSTEDGELTFWRDDLWNYTNGSGVIWVNASNNTQTMYVYYNGTSTTDKSNINDTFIYGDNFRVPTLDSNVYNIWGTPAPKIVSTDYFDPNGDSSLDSGITVSRGINISKGINLNVYAVRSLKAANFYHLEFGLDTNNRTVDTQGQLAVRTMIRGDTSPNIEKAINGTNVANPNNGAWHNYSVRIPPGIIGPGNNVTWFIDGIKNASFNATLLWNASNITFPYLQGRDVSDDLSLVDWFMVSSYSNSIPVFTISEAAINLINLTVILPLNETYTFNTTPTFYGNITNINGSWNISLVIDGNINNNVSINPALFTEGLRNNLVSYWNFEETSGTSAIDIVGGKNGTINGTTINQAGKIGKAYSYDGVNDYVNFSNLGISGANSRTISAWIKKTGTVQTPWSTIVGWAGSNVNYRWFDITIGGPTVGNESVMIHAFGQETAIKSVSDFGTTDFNHVVISYDGSRWYAWFNGTLIVNATATVNTDGNFRMGAGTAAVYFNGSIDEVGVWNRSITGDEVQALYNGGLGRTYTVDKYNSNFNITSTTLTPGLYLWWFNATSDGPTQSYITEKRTLRVAGSCGTTAKKNCVFSPDSISLGGATCT